MKAAAAAAIMAAIMLVTTASAGNQSANWKSQVLDNCHRLIVTAKWTAKDGYSDGYVNAHRLGKLRTRATQCQAALNTIP